MSTTNSVMVLLQIVRECTWIKRFYCRHSLQGLVASVNSYTSTSHHTSLTILSNASIEAWIGPWLLSYHVYLNLLPETTVVPHSTHTFPSHSPQWQKSEDIINKLDGSFRYRLNTCPYSASFSQLKDPTSTGTILNEPLRLQK